MDQATHNKIVSFIWGIVCRTTLQRTHRDTITCTTPTGSTQDADDVLRDLFKRGNFRLADHPPRIVGILCNGLRRL